MATKSSLHSLGGPGNGDLAASAVGPDVDMEGLESSPVPGSSPMDLERIQRAVREILLAVGEDPDREGLRETPDRVARMYAEVF